MRQLMLSCSVLMAALSPLPAFGDCAGDCENDGEVTVDELIRGVSIALGASSLSECLAFDSSGDQTVTVDEIIGAVNNALNGCAVPQMTPTPQATPTATVGVNISPALLGVFSGNGVNTTGGGTRSVRLEVKIEGGAVVVEDLNGNLFEGGSSRTMMLLDPMTLLFVNNTSGRTETLQLALNPANNSILNGSYSNLTLTFPPVGTSVALVLNKQS